MKFKLFNLLVLLFTTNLCLSMENRNGSSSKIDCSSWTPTYMVSMAMAAKYINNQVKFYSNPKHSNRKMSAIAGDLNPFSTARQMLKLIKNDIAVDTKNAQVIAAFNASSSASDNNNDDVKNSMSSSFVAISKNPGSNALTIHTAPGRPNSLTAFESVNSSIATITDRDPMTAHEYPFSNFALKQQHIASQPSPKPMFDSVILSVNGHPTRSFLGSNFINSSSANNAPKYHRMTDLDQSGIITQNLALKRQIEKVNKARQIPELQTYTKRSDGKWTKN